MINKFILNACCGSRMFWFDKKQPNTIFHDIRSYDKGFIDNRRNNLALEGQTPSQIAVPNIQIENKNGWLELIQRGYDGKTL